MPPQRVHRVWIYRTVPAICVFVPGAATGVHTLAKRNLLFVGIGLLVFELHRHIRHLALEDGPSNFEDKVDDILNRVDNRCVSGVINE